MSFLPGLRVRIAPTEIILLEYDLVCLVTPKWTFNCPPVTEYIHRLNASQNKPFAIFLVFGGHGEKKYLQTLSTRVIKKGGRIISTYAIRSDQVRNGAYKDVVEKFHNSIESGVLPVARMGAHSSSPEYSLNGFLEQLIKNS